MSNRRTEFGEQTGGERRFKLLYVSRSAYEGEWHSTPHSHHCTEFFYVISGAGRFQIEEMTFPVAAGDMIVVNPRVEHTEIGNAQKPIEYIVLGMEGGDFVLPEGKDSRYLAFKCGRVGREFLYYMTEMQREMEERKDWYAKAAGHLLDLFLIKLVRYRQVEVVPEPDAKSSRECANVKRYIDTHYDENLTLDELAAIAHLNKYYLAHVFTRENGCSPIQYLISRRIEESRYFLVNTNYSVSQISQILGFSSPSYFSQCFRRAVGQSPTTYRAEMQASGAVLQRPSFSASPTPPGVRTAKMRDGR